MVAGRKSPDGQLVRLSRFRLALPECINAGRTSVDEKLGAELVSIISDVWQREHRPILLSAVGAKLSDAAKEFIRTHRISLKPYIRSYLPQVRMFVISPGRDAAAPLADTAEYTDEQLSSFYKARVQISPRRSPRFLREIWAAFITDIPQGHRRFVDVRKRPVVSVDLPESSSQPDGWIEVSVSDQSTRDPLSGRRDNSTVGAAIRTWCAMHGLNATELIDPIGRIDEYRAPSGQMPASEKAIQTVTGKDHGALLAFLSSLSPSELIRISFSGDVLLSILVREKS